MAFSTPSSNGNRRRIGSSLRTSMGTMSEMNVVPLVDVVLVLLIIFMLTAHVMEFGLEINVPEVKPTSSTVQELPVVSITRDGKIFLNEKPANIHQLGPEIARRFKGTKAVYVMADSKAIFDPVAQVIAELGEAKYAVSVVTKPIDSSKR
jgi:biopolymer transport protein ExbD